MELDLNALAEAHLRNHRSSDRSYKDEDFWAWKEVRRLIEEDPEAAWRVTLLLLDKAESDAEVGYIAAGPLEDFIDFHGHTALDRIDEVVDRNQRLQLALSTVGVLYYYDEFDRWYDLLYRYGYRKDRVGDPSIIADAMKVMKAYMDGSINVCDYSSRLTGLLDKPFEDKTAQRSLQQRCLDVEHMEIQRLLNDREPYIAKPELKRRVAETLAELEALGYKGSTYPSLERPSDVYFITIIGNVDECRAECEISEENDTVVAVVYEADDGWHLETLKPVQAEELDDFNATVAAAKQNLSLYVNRLGANPPAGLTAAGLSLWLMEKGEGSALGIILPEVYSDVPSRLDDITPEVERRVRLLAKNGRQIEAIRELRRATDCSLQQAKAWLNK